MLTGNQLDDIEMLALRGQAVASVVGSSPNVEFEGSSPEKVNLCIYALECYFGEILEKLAQVRAELSKPKEAQVSIN